MAELADADRVRVVQNLEAAGRWLRLLGGRLCRRLQLATSAN